MDTRLERKLQYAAACGPVFLAGYLISFGLLGHNHPPPSPAYTPLVSWVVNSFTVSGEGFQDLVSALGPDERPGVLVPLVDPLADVGFELGDAAVG